MSKTIYTASLRRLLVLSGLLLAFGAPAHAESLLGTYAAALDSGRLVHGSNQYVERSLIQTASIIVRFEQKGGNYPLAGRLISASTGVYTGRGSGTTLWEVRNTGRTCGLYNNAQRLTIYEGTIFNETSGTSALGHIYAGNTPTGFVFVTGRPNGPASEANQQIADSCAMASPPRIFRKTD
jgi:hypothetical protein